MLAIAFLFGIDNKDVDDFGFDVLKKELEFMDKDLAGAWYLYNTNNSKYQKVENDEFEWHDAIEEAYNNLSKRVEQSKKTIGQVYSLNLNSSFGEYNFKEEFFH